MRVVVVVSETRGEGEDLVGSAGLARGTACRRRCRRRVWASRGQGRDKGGIGIISTFMALVKGLVLTMVTKSRLNFARRTCGVYACLCVFSMRVGGVSLSGGVGGRPAPRQRAGPGKGARGGRPRCSPA